MLFLAAEIVNSSTSQQTTIQWNLFPTVSPRTISTRNPYLYYTTITFGLIIVGTAILLISRACFRTSETRSPYNCQHHHCQRPVYSCFRLSLVSSDAILINERISEDKPPDYESVIHTEVETSKNSRNQEYVSIFSESPPPSYGTIVNSDNTKDK